MKGAFTNDVKLGQPFIPTYDILKNILYVNNTYSFTANGQQLISDSQTEV